MEPFGACKAEASLTPGAEAVVRDMFPYPDVPLEEIAKQNNAVMKTMMEPAACPLRKEDDRT